MKYKSIMYLTKKKGGKFNGPRGDFYKNMFAKCTAGRPHISFYFQRTT